MIIPLFLKNDIDIKAIEEAHKDHKLIFVTTKKEPNSVGTIGAIIREVKLPNGKLKILFQGLAKGTIKKITSEEPLKGVIDIVENRKEESVNKSELNALIETLKDKVEELTQYNPLFPRDIIKIVDENTAAKQKEQTNELASKV
jgi:ATP-dependent Lon protease